MILLDTDVLIQIMDKNSLIGDKLLKFIEKNKYQIISSSLNLEEILFGIFKRSNINELPKNHPLGNLPILPYTKVSAHITALIEVEMEKLGKKKPRGDAMIASVAIENNIPLFTLNVKHFQGIPNLELVNFKDTDND